MPQQAPDTHASNRSHIPHLRVSSDILFKWRLHDNLFKREPLTNYSQSTLTYLFQTAACSTSSFLKLRRNLHTPPTHLLFFSVAPPVSACLPNARLRPGTSPFLYHTQIKTRLHDLRTKHLQSTFSSLFPALHSKRFAPGKSLSRYRAQPHPIKTYFANANTRNYYLSTPHRNSQCIIRSQPRARTITPVKCVTCSTNSLSLPLCLPLSSRH